MVIDFNGKSPKLNGNKIFIAQNATLIGNIELDEDVSVWFSAVIRGDANSIKIASGSNVQDCAVIHVDENYPVFIGKNVTIGHGAIVHGCTIEDNVLIGMGATVLNGAVIGRGSVIGANALIGENKIIPPNSLVVGVPGRVIKTIGSEEEEKIIHNANVYIKNKDKFMGLI